MNQLEDRLRDAFAARAELVTPGSLRREPPPPPAVRRLPRWIVPGVTGLAVAATAAGVLFVTAPPRQAAQASRPTPAASRTEAPSPVPTPTLSAPLITATQRPSITATPQPGPRVPVALAQVIRASGWTAQVPSTWSARSSGSGTGAEVTCLGTDEQPCLVRLAAGLDASSPPDPAELGGTVLPGFSGSGCRRGSEGHGSGTQGSTVTRFPWTCGQQRYEQVTVESRMLLAVARIGNGTTIEAVARALTPDASYVRDYVVHACPDIRFGEHGDDVVSGLTVAGVRCAEANAVVLDLAAVTGPVSGPPTVNRNGWACTVVRTDAGLPAADVTCRRPAGESVSWTRN